MTVKELIDKLNKFNPYTEVRRLQIGDDSIKYAIETDDIWLYQIDEFDALTGNEDNDAVNEVLVLT